MKRRMKPSVKKLLNLIDEHLAKGNDASRDLWYVLSALRGPDLLGVGCSIKHDTPVGYRISSLKYDTTCVIRSKALPKTSKRNPIDLPVAFNDFGKFNSLAADEVSNHFKGHVENAARVLGLIDDDEDA